jgi:phage host-nuclease inhibitor protein Gam
MDKQYKIVEPVEYRMGMCSNCGKIKPVVKVIEIKTGKIEWRCREHVYYLENGRKVAHKLADMNIKRMSREKKRPEG